MQIALIDPSLFTAPYDEALAAGLQMLGHEVTLHGRRPGPEDSRFEGAPLSESFYRFSGSRIVATMPAPLRLSVKGLDHTASMALLARRLTLARPDVVHFQWLPLPIVDRRFLPVLRRIAPLVLTIHDSHPFNGAPTSGLQMRGIDACYPAFSRLIVHTNQGRERLLRHGITPDRVVVLPHGLLGAPPAARNVGSQGPLTFLLFGKIKPYKGLDLLVEAFAALPEKLAMRARLHVIGKPYMNLAPLQTRIERLGLAGRITIEPRFAQDEEVPGLFGSNTVAVLPYREIEASGVLSVAIRQGCPILAARLGGFAETVTDGLHGLLVPPGDAVALTAAMVRFLAEPDFVVSCAHAVRALSEKIPDWAEIARQTVAVYNEAEKVERDLRPAPQTRSRKREPARLMTERPLRGGRKL